MSMSMSVSCDNYQMAHYLQAVASKTSRRRLAQFRMGSHMLWIAVREVQIAMEKRTFDRKAIYKMWVCLSSMCHGTRG